MSKKKIELDREKQEEFLSDIATVFERHPDVASSFALAKVDDTESSRSPGTKKCIKWGVDPITGRRRCLKWVPAD